MASKPVMFVLGLLAFAMPARVTGRHYLEQQLEGYDIPRGTLPRACLQALVDKIIERRKLIAAYTKSSRPFKADLVLLIDSLAWGVASILRPENNKWGKEINEETELRHLLLGFEVDLPPRPATWRRPFS
jgi:hypothetical protein